MGRPKGSKNLHPKPLEGRFWEKVDKTDGCWIWIGSKNRQGYGTFGINGKVSRANRVSWEIHFGPIPNGMLVCHACDNPSCVRPDHLFLGTLKENALDMVRKGRGKIPKLHGDDCPWSKTTSNIVIEIRSLYDSGTHTQAELSKLFNMNIRQIGKIVRRERWKHIP